MNKKITYALLLVFVGLGIIFFVQAGKMGFEVKNEFNNLEMPIIVISMLATGVALAFPSLLYTASKQKETVLEESKTESDSLEEKKNEAVFSLEEFQQGIKQLKVSTLENKFWFFCEYYKVNLGCIYTLEDKSLRMDCMYGITVEESDRWISATESLGAMALQSGKIEACIDIPEHYFKIQSGLGETKPSRLVFIPLEQNGEYLLELASFWQYEEEDLLLLQESAKIVLAA